MHVIVEFSTFDVEYVDQHLHISENVILLWRKILLHKAFLASAIPQVQHYKSYEFLWISHCFFIVFH